MISTDKFSTVQLRVLPKLFFLPTAPRMKIGLPGSYGYPKQMWKFTQCILTSTLSN